MVGNPNIGGINQFHNNQNGNDAKNIKAKTKPNTKIKAKVHVDNCNQKLFN